MNESMFSLIAVMTVCLGVGSVISLAMVIIMHEKGKAAAERKGYAEGFKAAQEQFTKENTL